MNNPGRINGQKQENAGLKKQLYFTVEMVRNK
jgi:hypothetical protein